MHGAKETFVSTAIAQHMYCNYSTQLLTIRPRLGFVSSRLPPIACTSFEVFTMTLARRRFSQERQTWFAPATSHEGES